ncbi:MAG TPA: hypothetical protein VKC54_02570 [Patescibacteria group bacterium]|nr:hypothetical protein [Patescibacteria group bacterium]
MKERSPNIEKAVNFESAIEIIPEEICKFGLEALEFELALLTNKNPKDFVVIPIMDGGARVGGVLTGFTRLATNPMKMSHYDSQNKRIEKPVCELAPDIDKIIVSGKVRQVIFAEGVVETEGTVLESIDLINKLVEEKGHKDGIIYPYPIYRTYSLISKVEGYSRIPNFIYPFWVDSKIWVHGWGVDNGKRGREMNSILGVLSPFAKNIPQKPYFRTTPIYRKYFETPTDFKKC